MVDDERTPWDLFVYVDGRPLASCSDRSSSMAMHREHLALDESLVPGRHVVRLLQEQHELESRRHGTWSHRARVFSHPIVLDLDAGGSWEVTIRVEESDSILTKGRTRYAVIRDGRTVDEGARTGPRPDTWPALCEELEAEPSPKRLSSKAVRRSLEDCVRWDSLWEGVPHYPDRTTVREEMKGYGFKPSPTPSK
jgi:hypothetical protein